MEAGRHIYKCILEEAAPAIFPSLRVHNKSLYDGLLDRPENLDKFCPFREQCPSRRALLRKLDKEFLETLSGLFSLMVARGITFTCKFLRKLGRCRFKKPKHFHKAREGMDLADVRDNCAYGRSKDREPSNAKQYWRYSQQWPKFLEEGHDFPDLCRWLFGKKTGYNIPTETNPKHCKAFGDLTVYLTAADIAYAGLVEYPSSYEVGLMVFKLKKGAFKCLKKLRVITDSCREHTVASKFEEVSSTLKALVVDSQIIPSEVAIDDFLVEHTLCKFSKCLHKQWI